MICFKNLAAGILIGILAGSGLAYVGLSLSVSGGSASGAAANPTEVEATDALKRRLASSFPNLSLTLGECTPGGAVSAGVMCAARVKLAPTNKGTVRSVGYARINDQWEVTLW